MESPPPALAEHLTQLPPLDARWEGSLAWLDDLAREADVLGLGDATHGTREWFTLKRRVVPYLVTGCGYRTIALETDATRTLALNRYVMDGSGTPQQALENLQLWVWKTEGMCELLSWLREFNQGRKPGDRVRFHGVSLGSPAIPAAALLDRDAVHSGPPDASERTLETLARLELPDDETGAADLLDDSILDRGVELAGQLADDLGEGADETVRSRRVTRYLVQQLEYTCQWTQLRLRTPGGFDPEGFERRDAIMAENVQWCHETDAGDGVLVWAHNTHVKRGNFDLGYDWASGRSMGEVLATDLPVTYRVIGADFERGNYRAVPTGDQSSPTTFETGKPESGTITAALAAQASHPRVLDLRTACADERVSEWLAQERSIRGIGALVASSSADRHIAMQTDCCRAFDALVFVPRTEPSVPLESADSRS